MKKSSYSIEGKREGGLEREEERGGLERAGGGLEREEG